MARVDVEELDAERRPGAVADLEAQHLLVEVAHLLEVRGDQRHVADAQLAGAETAQRAPRHEGVIGGLQHRRGAGLGKFPGHGANAAIRSRARATTSLTSCSTSGAGSTCPISGECERHWRRTLITGTRGRGSRSSGYSWAGTPGTRQADNAPVTPGTSLCGRHGRASGQFVRIIGSAPSPRAPMAEGLIPIAQKPGPAGPKPVAAGRANCWPGDS